MKVAFSAEGWDDYVHWQNTDRSMLKRVNRLIQECVRDPAAGIGKPESLKHVMEQTWSRRVSEEHRLVYTMVDDTLVVLQCRFHYVRR